MLEAIRIARIATYGEEPQNLECLRQVNFLFGTNGSGKTTISRVLADPTAYPSCEIVWQGGRPLETLVYNRDFVENNFTQPLRGIFTLGEVAADTLEKIEKARAKVQEIESQLVSLKTTLGEPSGPTGKYAELHRLRDVFEEQCWGIKTTHDPHFQAAFSGLRNSRTRFCDRVLEENAKNQATLRPIEELKARAETVFRENVEQLTLLCTISGADLLHLEQEPLLSKKIVGKEDIDVGALIRHLGNSDWVRQGLQYTQGTDSPCPFCQKTLEKNLLDKLNAYFDEAYIAEIDVISRTLLDYRTFSDTLLQAINKVLESGSAHIDVEMLHSLRDRAHSITSLNIGHIERKLKEPSTPIALEPLTDALGAITAIVDQANTEIARHNELVDNLASERTNLTAEVWKRLITDKQAIIDLYLSTKGNLDKAVEGLSKNIEKNLKELTEAKSTLTDLDKKITSVQPTVTEINAILTSFGFTSFKLATAGDRNEFYRILRSDGSDAKETLSEGERSFVTFLYFYHLIRGSMTASGVNFDRVIVIDDPVSSLDSDVLFIVSTLIKRILSEAIEGSGRVKQVFMLTHNIYFYKEVTFNSHRKQARRSSEMFWVVRKVNDISTIKKYDQNPIKTSYELLWDEVKSPDRSNVTIPNVLRRILEHYFTILGNMNKDALIEKFEGRDKQICASLFAWINDGSHNFTDDLYVIEDETTILRYLSVFKQIFIRANHGAHYAMMTGEETAEAEPVVEAGSLV